MATGPGSAESSVADQGLSALGAEPFRTSIWHATPEELRLSMSSIVGAASALESNTTCFFIRLPLYPSTPARLIFSKKLFGCRVNRTACVQITVDNHPPDPGLIRGTRYWLLLPCESET